MEEIKKKKRFIKLIIAEFFMVTMVLILTVFFVLWAMGYKINSRGQLEQNGLIHVISSPANSNVIVDSQQNFMRIGSSKLISAGKHKISVEKEGFTTWQKEIEVKSGLLSQLFYVKLFPLNKTIEEVKKIEEPMVWSIAPNRESALYAARNSTDWKIINLKNPKDEAEKNLTLKNLLCKFFCAENQQQPIGEIAKIDWSKSGESLLVKMRLANHAEWLLINIKQPQDSVNLSERLAIPIDDLKFADDNGEKFWLLENRNLREAELRDLKISAALFSDVEKLYSDGKISSLVFKQFNQNQSQRFVALHQEGDKNFKTIDQVSNDGLVLISNWEYFGEKYLAIVEKNLLKIFKDRNLIDKNILTDTPYLSLELPDSPNSLEISSSGQLVVMRSKNSNMIFDLDSENLHHFTDSMGGFVDGALFWRIKNQKMHIVDFDNTNEREVDFAESLPATITPDNKWLYFLQQTADNGLTLRRLDLVK